MKTSPLITSNDYLSKKRKIRIEEVSQDELSLDSLRIISVDKVKPYSSINGGSQQGQPGRATSSTFSSIVLDNNKGGVKRKLNFDADGSSDEDSAIRRENGKRRCLRDFRSMNSSLIDTDSNTFSPSKNHRRSVASHSRSSISSSCRRRLFPYHKKKTDELGSPISRPIVDPKNEIRLSLKKKFPGVPNSDNARSGLLLNLAFSKFNLPNAASSDKKSNVSYDFVDHDSVSKTTKKEYQYSSIKKDDTSMCKSPVFTAIKKVKRRLNLEEQENYSDTKDGDSSFGDKERTPKNSNANDASSISKVASVKKPSFAGVFPKKNDCEKQLRTDSTSEIGNSSRRSLYQSSPVIHKKEQASGNLFKNSRLRLSLRNKIFDLSTLTTDGGGHSAANINTNNPKSAETSTGITHASLQVSSNERSFSSKDSSNRNNKPKYDHIVMLQDMAERTRRDTERLKRLSALSTETFDKVSRKPSTGRCARGLSSNKDFCKVKSSNSFIDSHMKRFLNDCSDMAKLKLNSSKDESPLPMSEVMNVDDSISSSFDELSQSEPAIEPVENTSISDSENNLKLVKSSTFIEESDSNSNSPFDKKNCADFSVSRIVIEDIHSQELERPVEESQFTIENICTQESIKVGVERRIHDITMEENDSVGTLLKDNISSSSDSVEVETVRVDHKIEEAKTPESVFVDYINDNCQSHDPEQLLPDTEDILNSQQKKRSRKKHGSDSLCGRLQRLVKREKSEAHIWEYEASKRETCRDDVAVEGVLNKPTVFSIEKMWKEFSRLVILCSRIHSDSPGVRSLKNLGTKISHSVVIIIESELFPKSITCSSTFRVHPPWKIFYLSALNVQIIFRPTKIEMVSANGKPLLYKDSTLPSHPITVEKRQFCVCFNSICDCVLPESYLTVMPSLLPLFSNFNIPTTCCLKSYGPEDVQSIRSIDDLIIKYRLLFAEFPMDFKLLTVDCSFDEVFRFIIGVNDQGETCCILIKADMKNLPSFRVFKKYRFTGLIPWKSIPPRLVPRLVKHLKLTEVDLISKFQTNGFYVFVLSGQFGNIHPVYS